MTVYVDDMRAPYRHRGRTLIMCHMIGDTAAELHTMAARIGVTRRHYQGDHYDVCLAKRAQAIALGAVEITRMQLGRRVMAMRKAQSVAPESHHDGCKSAYSGSNLGHGVSG